MKSYDRLKEYIEEDQIYQDYKSGKLTELSDFDKFCINHINDIQELLDTVKSLKSRIKTIKRRRKEQTKKIRKYKELITNTNNSLAEKNKKIDKAIEKLYCWGETLHPEFQQEMLKILGESEQPKNELLKPSHYDEDIDVEYELYKAKKFIEEDKKRKFGKE